jgi:GT2 family glycosyltransferase
MDPNLSIIIPTHRGGQLLQECLRSLQDQAFDDFEIIVVDDASPDDSAGAVAASFPKTSLIRLPTQSGFAAACNRGIRASGGRYVALLNDDALPDPAWAASLVQSLEAWPEVGFCASKVVFHSSPDLVDSCGDYYAREGVAGKIGHLENPDLHRNAAEVFGASACAAIYRRSLLDEVGGFDEDFFLVHEDTDLSFRARLLGYTCRFVPTAVARHRVSATLGYRSALADYFASRNQEFVFLKNTPGSLLARYIGLHLMANLLQFTAHARRGRARVWMRGKWASARALPRILAERTRIQREARVGPDAIDQVLARNWRFDALRRRAAARL